MNKSKCLICGTEAQRYSRQSAPGVCGRCYLENKKMVLKGYWHLDKGIQSEMKPF